jgi:TRAP-type C4-dicarboxylate transport system substrate-binding protein
MRGKRLFALYATICLALILVALPLVAACEEEVTPPPGEEEEVTPPPGEEEAPPQTFHLTVVSGLPEGHAGNRDFAFWTTELEERTGGRVTTEVYEGTLGSPPEFYDMIKEGVIDVMSMGDAWASAQFPIYAVNMLPFEYPNWQVLTSVLDELYYAGYFPDMEVFKLLYLKPTVFMYPFFTEKKVTKLEDFKGLVMRPPGGPIFSATVEALGATAKSLPGAETYMALSTGQVEGAITGMDNVIGRKFYEVVKYGIKDAPVFGGSFFMIMNWDTWNSLSADIQVIIEQLDRETYYYFLRGQFEEEEGYWVQAEAEGVELYTIGATEFARWRAACANVADDWAAGLDAQGMPGSEIVDLMRAIVARYTQ